MSDVSDDGAPPISFEQLYASISDLFESLGRGLICLDADFRVRHASEGLDRLVGGDARGTLLGRPVEEVFGEELFGPHGTLRRPLQGGERREGWGATLRAGSLPPKIVSITCAPLRHADGSVCDPDVSYLVVVRPREDVEHLGEGSPTVFAGIVARSASMNHIFRLVQNLEESEATILVEGESGTGKELVARAIHVHSPRRSGPFVAVNCGALPRELLESELFGHVRGAFTGAIRDRVGRFGLATDGTLFLDEVGEIPLPLQVKLLRVLQERVYEPVGESRSKTTNARIIAATNRDLQRSVLEGTFRDDLYYRLRVVPIVVPPLRERREDVEPLAHHLLHRIAARYGRSMLLGRDALRVLLRHDWPGNVRELENALEFAIAICRGQTIHAQDLPPEIGSGGTAPAGRPAAPRSRRPEEAGTDEAGGGDDRERILGALERNRWRRDDTARELGISRSTLWRRMRELDLV